MRLQFLTRHKHSGGFVRHNLEVLGPAVSDRAQQEKVRWEIGKEVFRFHAVLGGSQSKLNGCKPWSFTDGMALMVSEDV